MYKMFIIIASLYTWQVAAAADAVYRSEKNGVTVYSSKAGIGGTKIELPPLSILPSVKKQPHEQASDSPKSKQTTTTASEGQQARESKRADVLQEEQEREEKLLEQAQKELDEQEKVRNGNEKNYQKYLDRVQPYKDTVLLHKKNIDAIKQERQQNR